MNIQPAFATPLTKIKYSEADGINDRIDEIIREMSRESPSDDEGRAHVGGWYSRDGFLSREDREVVELKSFFVRSLRQYMAKVVDEAFAKQAQISIRAWVALTRAGEYQTPHVHPRTHVSGVYYVKVPDRPSPEGSLSFLTPVGEQELEFFSSVAATTYRVNPKAGDLVLFPSYLRHYTHPFSGDGYRSVVVFTANAWD